MEESIFREILFILLLCSVIGVAAIRFGQPLIIAFIVAGILSGPEVFDIVGADNQGFIETLAGLGIVLLLFMVGLKLDPRIVKDMGGSALAAGILQIALTTAAGLMVSMAVGFSLSASVLTGLAVSFSSTIVTVKLLSDARAVDSLYGRMAVGILIVQDIAVIFSMIALAVFRSENNDAVSVPGIPGSAAAGLALLLVFTVLFINFAAERIMKILARHGELMTIFCLTFAATMAALCDILHLSRELGGLLAGMMLAPTSCNTLIASRLHTLRDFLLLFFFAHLGAHLDIEKTGDALLPAFILSIFVFAGKPLIVMSIMKSIKFPARIGFLTGISLSQISEFSLILTAMGASSGLIGNRELAAITGTALVTMASSSMIIPHGRTLYQALEKRSRFFRDTRFSDTQATGLSQKDDSPDAILFGLGRYGLAIAKMLQTENFKVLGIDFDPDAITAARKAGIQSVYGDASDPEIVESLPFYKTKVAIFAFHHHSGGIGTTDLRRTLAKAMKDNGYRGHIAATSHYPGYDQDLSKSGVDIVLNPFDDAAVHGTATILKAIRS